jgi:hypothetical protein
MQPNPIIFFEDRPDGYKLDIKFKLHEGNHPLIVIGIKKNNQPFIQNLYNIISGNLYKVFPDV